MKSINQKCPRDSKDQLKFYKHKVSLKDIKKGDIFTNNNLAIKRPGNGKSPMKWDEIIGTLATQNYSKDDLI